MDSDSLEVDFEFLPSPGPSISLQVNSGRDMDPAAAPPKSWGSSSSGGLDEALKRRGGNLQLD
jgi:hypothetical protein